MIKTSADMQWDIRENMRGGDGTTKIQHIVNQDELKGHARLVGRICLEPGASIGLHPHDQEEEIYYILSGQGIVVDDGNRQVVNPGDAVVTGGGATHSIANAGSEPLEFVAVILTY